jgi:PilZ domain
MKFGRGKADTPHAAIELPERSQTVTLIPPKGARIPARVLDSGQQCSLLVAITVPTPPLSASQLEGLVVEFQGPQGRVHLEGAATIDDPSDPDVLRIESPRSIDVVQEREHVRIKSMRSALVFGGPNLTQINSYTVDLSGGGFLLAGADALMIGDEVQFQIELNPGELPVCGSGKVMRIDLHGHRGIAFESIKDLDQRRLIRFIFECQRAELRLGLDVERHGD